MAQIGDRAGRFLVAGGSAVCGNAANQKYFLGSHRHSHRRRRTHQSKAVMTTDEVVLKRLLKITFVVAAVLVAALMARLMSRL